MFTSEMNAFVDGVDEVDEYNCQSCGQVPICLNSTGSGHEVCDDCLSLWKEDTKDVCPILACKIPSHMANKIKIIQEDLQLCKCSNEKATEEVLGQFSSLYQNLAELNLNVNEIENDVKDIKTEMQEMNMEIWKQQQGDHETRAEVTALMTNSRQLEDYEKLKTKCDQMKEENLELKKKLKKVEDQLEGFQSSMETVAAQLKENMFLVGNSNQHNFDLPMTGFNLMVKNAQFQPVFSWTIKDIKQKIESDSFEEECSKFFPWSGYPIKARAKLNLNAASNCFIMTMRLKESDHVDTTTGVKLLPNVYYLLRNQNGAEIVQHKIEVVGYTFPSTFSTDKIFNKKLAHKTWLTHQLYNVDDAVTIDIYVESPSMARQVHSHNGVLNWVIKDCAKRQLFEKGNFIHVQESPYFYTAPNGNKVQVQLGLNGLGPHKGKGPSAYIKFLQGKYDALLPWTFNYQATITLVSPNDPERYVTKIIDSHYINQGSDRVDICDLNELAKLIENDTLFVKVNIVKTTP